MIASLVLIVLLMAAGLRTMAVIVAGVGLAIAIGDFLAWRKM
jgi:hypothetical protein